MKNNHLRMILCLFMCCALLFTCVAKPASATSVAVVAGLAAIPAAVAVATAFQALGVMSASNSSGFTTTVDNCTTWLSQNSDLVVNGTVALLGLTQDGVTTSYLSKNFVQTVWEWLYSSKTVQKQELSISSSVTIPAEAFATAAAAPYSIFVCTEKVSSGYKSYKLAYSYESPLICKSSRDDGLGYSIIPEIANAKSFLWSGENFDEITGILASANSSNRIVSVQRIGTSDPIVYETTQELSLGSIQSPYQTTKTEEETIQIEIAPIYIDWTKYGVPDPNNPETPPEDDPAYRHWLPTGIPSPEYDDSVIKQNQQQAQSGVVSGDISFEPYQPDSPGSGGGGGTGTDLSSIIQTIVNVPTAIVSGIGAFISDFFGFNENHDGYVVQLRDFFPFCIPFDLFDFITVLSAEPEAPVFHWEIPVPQLGQTFELEVDLSAWDDIAVLFRNLELLAFIFGLAVMTREKFLRS